MKIGITRLDMALAQACLKIATGEFGRQMVLFAEREARHDRREHGRQLHFLIHFHQCMSEVNGCMFDFQHLQNVHLHGDNLEQFAHNWDHVNLGLRSEISSDIVHKLFYEQVKKSHKMKAVIDHYDLVGEGHSDHSMHYLHCPMQRILAKERQEKLNSEMSKGLKGGEKKGLQGTQKSRLQILGCW